LYVFELDQLHVAFSVDHSPMLYLFMIP
jgi:hypothetical protein